MFDRRLVRRRPLVARQALDALRPREARDRVERDGHVLALVHAILQTVQLRLPQVVAFGGAALKIYLDGLRLRAQLGQRPRRSRQHAPRFSGHRRPPRRRAAATDETEYDYNEGDEKADDRDGG